MTLQFARGLLSSRYDDSAGGQAGTDKRGRTGRSRLLSAPQLRPRPSTGRTQSYTYDEMNRLATAQSQANSPDPNCWGLS